ncbi:MAG TPA: CDP-alcohol phosphatidyltransferase family protein [Terriglobales bacterium]|nr:CDP-alcohol phosphatidyltransferase family protein [Terriglobales bacterium]
MKDLKDRFWTAPNQLTLLRLIFVPFVVMNVLDHDYGWALGLFIGAGLSDALDGLLARVLEQRTRVGQFLDPIADKLLLSSMFMVLSFTHQIPWRYTVIVFSRDLCILVIAAALYMTTSIHDFRPSIFGKLNTVAQVGAVFFVLLANVTNAHPVWLLQKFFLYATFALTTLSGIHYILLTGQRLHGINQGQNT